MHFATVPAPEWLTLPTIIFVHMLRRPLDFAEILHYTRAMSTSPYGIDGDCYDPAAEQDDPRPQRDDFDTPKVILVPIPPAGYWEA